MGTYKNKILSAGAICLILTSIFYSVINISYVYTGYMTNMDLLPALVYWISWFIVGITLIFPQRTAKIRIGATIICILRDIYWLIMGLLIHYKVFSVREILLASLPQLSCLTLSIIILCNSSTSVNKRNICKSIWCIPGVMKIVYDIVRMFPADSTNNEMTGDIIFSIVFLLALFLITYGLKTLNLKNDEEANSNLKFIPTNLNGADKLKLYKELLDSGAITQEEFEEKKKQVLGL